MRHQRPADADAVRFTALWQAHADRVLAYATRHVGPDAAQEVVAETFLVAWRRLADVPGHELPWLLVVARNTVANHRRSAYRRGLLHDELALLLDTAAPSQAAEVTATDRAHVLAALARLSDKEREALLLLAWDGLVPADAAKVAGCSLSAFHVRLFRARRRLRDDAGDALPDARPSPLVSSPRVPSPHPITPHRQPVHTPAKPLTAEPRSTR